MRGEPCRHLLQNHEEEIAIVHYYRRELVAIGLILSEDSDIGYDRGI